MWCILTLPFSYNVRLSIFEIKTLVKMLLMAFVVLNAVNGRKAYQWFLMALIIGTLIAAFGGITGLARGSEVIETAAGSQSRYVGAFGNPNGMGKLANTGFWAAICMFFLCRQKKMRIILIGISVLCVVVVGWTGSRQAIISLVLTLGGIYWFVVRRQAQNTGSKGVWLLVFAVLFVALIGFLSKTDFWHRMERLGGMLTGQ